MPVADPLAAKLFSIANVAVMPAWLLLAALPRWRGTQVVAAFVAPLLIGAAYGVLVIGYFAGDSGGGGDMFSLAGVMRLFDSPRAVLAGWLHYLAFDLFVGAWQVRDAQRRELPHLLLLPCLALTLMLGPLGLVSYLLLRLALRRSIDPDPRETRGEAA
ncbi:MAG: DUF4281 domain-containing protein [Myxococcales bacterium]|nr:DUF4281 domain-containing protein [Myxococcales bacterium]